MDFYYSQNDAQSQPGAARAPGARRVHPVRALENVGQLTFWDSLTGISYFNLDLFTGIAGLDRDGSVWGSVVQCVLHQVVKHPLHPLWVNVHRGEFLVNLAAQGESSSVSLGRHALQSVGDQILDGLCFDSMFHQPGIQLSQFKQVVDELA